MEVFLVQDVPQSSASTSPNKQHKAEEENGEIHSQAKQLLYVRSISDPKLFRNLNDVHIVDHSHFYVTNWIYYEEGSFLGYIEFFLKLSLGSIVVCVMPSYDPDSLDTEKEEEHDGSNCALAIEGLAFPNGINAFKGEDVIYVVYIYI